MNILVNKKKINTLYNQIKILENELEIYKNKYQSLKNNFRCIICMEDYVDYIPNCGHVGLCKNCVYNLADKRKCVICKRNIKYIEIFLPYSIEKIDILGEIIIENSRIIDFHRDNFLKEELEIYKNTIKTLEHKNKMLIKNNEYLLYEVKEIENAKKNFLYKKFLTLIKEIDFLKKNNMQNNIQNNMQKKSKNTRLCNLIFF